MEAFKLHGFVSRKPIKTPPPKPEAVWGGTEAQRKKIKAMWQTCARCKTEVALKKFVKRIAKVDHPRFLVADLARMVIIALEKMMVKSGFDPDTGEWLTQEDRAVEACK